jgi:hypothetical protein
MAYLRLPVAAALHTGGDAYPGRQQQNRAIIAQGEQVARCGNHQPLAGA